MGRIGKVVVFAGLIMSAVFLCFVTPSDMIGKMFGLGLGLAILIDVLIVRMVIAPAVVTLLGDRAWWLPGLAGPRCCRTSRWRARGRGSRPRRSAAGPRLAPVRSRHPLGEPRSQQRPELEQIVASEGEHRAVVPHPRACLAALGQHRREAEAQLGRLRHEAGQPAARRQRSAPPSARRSRAGPRPLPRARPRTRARPGTPTRRRLAVVAALLLKGGEPPRKRGGRAAGRSPAREARPHRHRSRRGRVLSPRPCRSPPGLPPRPPRGLDERRLARDRPEDLREHRPLAGAAASARPSLTRRWGRPARRGARGRPAGAGSAEPLPLGVGRAGGQECSSASSGRRQLGAAGPGEQHRPSRPRSGAPSSACQPSQIARDAAARSTSSGRRWAWRKMRVRPADWPAPGWAASNTRKSTPRGRAHKRWTRPVIPAPTTITSAGRCACISGSDGVVVANGQTGEQGLETGLDRHVVLLGVAQQDPPPRWPRSGR